MSLVLPSVQAREGNRVADRHSDEACMYFHTSRDCDVTMYPSLTHAPEHTHTHTHTNTNDAAL